jgi:hypothetical protein
MLQLGYMSNQVIRSFHKVYSRRLIVALEIPIRPPKVVSRIFVSTGCHERLMEDVLPQLFSPSLDGLRCGSAYQ